MKTTYQCQQCGATDSDNGNNPPAPAMLICWSCKAGRDQGSIGMLPVRTEEGTGAKPFSGDVGRL